MKSLSENLNRPFPYFKKNIIITIDGPSASGKSTVAHLLAKKLGYLYLDTGAMYRALTLKALKDKIDINNEESLSRLAETTRISLKPDPNSTETKVYLDGEDVTSQIRSRLVNKWVSPISTVKKLRENMVEQQRKIAKGKGVVAEGRDMGTVVFPQAEVKIFLVASIKKRIHRRWKEYQQKRTFYQKKDIEKELQKRDQIDTQREVSPLRKAEDAILIDNTNIGIPETLQKIWEMVEKKIK